MNQILQTKIKNSSNNGKKKSFLKVQFYISIFVFLSLMVYLFFYWQNLQKSEKKVGFGLRFPVKTGTINAGTLGALFA